MYVLTQVIVRVQGGWRPAWIGQHCCLCRDCIVPLLLLSVEEEPLGFVDERKCDQASYIHASQAYCSSALIQYLESSSCPGFFTLDHITGPSEGEAGNPRLSLCLFVRADVLVNIIRWGWLGNIQNYLISSRSSLQLLILCVWNRLCFYSLCLTQQQNGRGNRKGLSSSVLGRISSFGGVPPPLSLNSPSLYLLLSYGPPHQQHILLLALH